MKILFYIILMLIEPAFSGINFWRIKKYIENQKIKNFHSSFKTLPTAFFNTHISEDFFEQPLDHFDPQLKTTYKQRYFSNTQFWKKPSGPIFLYICGEGRLQVKTVLEGAFYEWASEHGALMLSVEHRFYGSSLNEDFLTTNNLQYLSSQQALADIASLSKHISTTYNLTQANKWISFGGSYAGALSAWLRLKYPHIISGSLSSSAPVRASTEFVDFNNVVAASLATPSVGGSTKCASAVKSAFMQIDSLISSLQLFKLSTDFQSCQLVSEDMLDLSQFVSNIADIFMSTVQYNNENRGPYNISNLCTAMLFGSDPYQSFIEINKNILKLTKQNCSDNSWKSYVTQLLVDRVNISSNDNAMRPWIYQTCTQFGYYQTCDPNSSCIFSKYMPLAPNLELCRLLFGMSPKQINEAVDFTNSYYGSDKIAGSNILFVNGLIDPWHALGILKDVSLSENAIVIPETAHCADLHASSPTDPLSLTNARKKINMKISEWIS